MKSNMSSVQSKLNHYTCVMYFNFSLQKFKAHSHQHTVNVESMRKKITLGRVVSELFPFPPLPPHLHDSSTLGTVQF